MKEIEIVRKQLSTLPPFLPDNLDGLASLCKEMIKTLKQLYIDLATHAEKLEQVEELLKENEWCRQSPSLSKPYKPVMTCPICCSLQENKVHDGGCWLGKVLSLLCKQEQLEEKENKMYKDNVEQYEWVKDKQPVCQICKGTGKEPGCSQQPEKPAETEFTRRIEIHFEITKLSRSLEEYDNSAFVGLAEMRKKYLQEAVGIIDHLTTERNALAKEVERHRWIPVSERLPKLYDCPHPHSPDVLLALSEIYLGWFEKDRGWRHSDGTVEVFPTHWKPIILPKKDLTNE